MKILQEFVPHPGRGAGADEVPLGQDFLPGRGVDGEADAGGVAQHPQHAHRVPLEAHRRVPDNPDAPGFQVLHASHVIHQGKVGDVVKQAVDGQVPALGILRRGAVGGIFRGAGFVLG